MALLGATGYVGSALVKEALGRGHTVTAIVRHPEKLEECERLVAKAGDVYDTSSLAKLMQGIEPQALPIRAFESKGILTRSIVNPHRRIPDSVKIHRKEHRQPHGQLESHSADQRRYRSRFRSCCSRPVGSPRMDSLARESRWQRLTQPEEGLWKVTRKGTLFIDAIS